MRRKDRAFDGRHRRNARPWPVVERDLLADTAPAALVRLTPPPSLPPKPAAGTYTAHAWAGGLDHLAVFKADFTANTCVHLRLASPQQPSASGALAGLKAPATWSVTGGDRTSDASTCKANAPRPDGIPAVDGKGLVTWDSGTNVLPCTLSIHAAVFFEKLKLTEQLDADEIPVDGCM